MSVAIKRERRKLLIILSIVAALGVIGTAGYYGFKTSTPPEQTIQAPPTAPVSRGEVKLTVTAPGQSVDLGAATLQSHVNANVAEILTYAGETVKKGQTLLRLGDRETFTTAITQAQIAVMQAHMTLDRIDDAAALAQAHLDLIQAQSDFDKAKNHLDSLRYPRASQTNQEAAYSQYLLAESRLAQAQQAYNNVSGLPADNLERAAALSQLTQAQMGRNQALANYNWLTGKPTEADRSEAQAQYDLAKAKLDQTQAAYDAIQAGHNPDRELAEAQLKNAQAALDQAEANLANLEVKAPFDGIITDVLVQTGQNVGVGGGLVTLSDPAAMGVSASVVEEDLPLIEVGQAVDLFFDALSDSNVTGKISAIIPKRLEGAQANYGITISLDAPVEHLVPGMSVDASIVISSKEGVLRLPRVAVRPRADNTAQVEVWDPQGQQIVKKEVTVGLRGDSFTEITGGLSEGELVVTR